VILCVYVCVCVRMTLLDTVCVCMDKELHWGQSIRSAMVSFSINLPGASEDAS
jgi:hypothetical protein